MKRTLLPLGLVILLLAVSLGSAFAQSESLSITVSPKAIFLDSYGTWLTIHTNFPLSDLDGAQVLLNNCLSPASIFADNQGNLVAKFDLEQAKGLIGATDNDITFTLYIGDNLSASDTVRVLKRDRICSNCRIYVN